MAAGTRVVPSGALPALVDALHRGSSASREGTAGPCQPGHTRCAPRPVSAPGRGHFKVRLPVRRSSWRGRGNCSAPTRLRIARNWVTLPESSGHSLQPLIIISFLPGICPFNEGQAKCGHTFGRWGQGG